MTILDGQKIKWVGTTDFSELYKYMKLWLEDKGYLKEEKTLEKKYIERMKGDKRQLEIIWEVEKAKSEFFNYRMKITFLILGMGDVEIQDNGVKRKVQKATFEIRVFSYVESTKKWEELKGIQGFYHHLFIRKRLDEYAIELYKKSTEYHSYIKTFLGLRD